MLPNMWHPGDLPALMNPKLYWDYTKPWSASPFMEKENNKT